MYTCTYKHGMVGVGARVSVSSHYRVQYSKDSFIAEISADFAGLLIQERRSGGVNTVAKDVDTIGCYCVTPGRLLVTRTAA
jgi:hypothetical protein